MHASKVGKAKLNTSTRGHLWSGMVKDILELDSNFRGALLPRVFLSIEHGLNPRRAAAIQTKAQEAVGRKLRSNALAVYFKLILNQLRFLRQLFYDGKH